MLTRVSVLLTALWIIKKKKKKERKKREREISANVLEEIRGTKQAEALETINGQ